MTSDWLLRITHKHSSSTWIAHHMIGDQHCYIEFLCNLHKKSIMKNWGIYYTTPCNGMTGLYCTLIASQYTVMAAKEPATLIMSPSSRSLSSVWLFLNAACCIGFRDCQSFIKLSSVLYDFDADVALWLLLFNNTIEVLILLSHSHTFWESINNCNTLQGRTVNQNMAWQYQFESHLCLPCAT